MASDADDATPDESIASPFEPGNSEESARVPADLEGQEEDPPPLPLPGASLASNSSIASSAELSGISVGPYLPQESNSGDEPLAHDLVERAGEHGPPNLPQPLLFDADPTQTANTPRADEHKADPFDDPPESPSVGRISPLFLETRAREGQVKKRLEIEVEITVSNMERITQIATDKSRGAFSQLAHETVYGVAQDLRTFRESYRQVWGR